ncbi:MULTISPECIES: hypothetical protein [Acetobacteraceae]|uniref:Uncharacterized protein n=1 Tax=Acetobacter lambici TaxID=1332824 RepID=A0ABT1F4I6_9PROT|nr:MULTISPECIES: hypothetical protein [Acetobacter]MCP1244116.1 hypothetical protein [Acetobacter lambici]MCP1260137.1 hypothetical protein [Acetobacter lambici]
MKFANQLDTDAERLGSYKRSGIERKTQKLALDARSRLNEASAGLF